MITYIYLLFEIQCIGWKIFADSQLKIYSLEFYQNVFNFWSSIKIKTNYAYQGSLKIAFEINWILFCQVRLSSLIQIFKIKGNSKQINFAKAWITI